MKIFTEVNGQLEQVELEQAHELHEQSSPSQILSIIALFAPVLIAIIRAWQTLPGRKRTARNAKLDTLIAALQAASLFSTFKQ